MYQTQVMLTYTLIRKSRMRPILSERIYQYQWTIMGNHWKIDWKDAGLQQVKIYAPNGLEQVNKDWKVEQEDNYYVLTRYGDKGELEITVK